MSKIEELEIMFRTGVISRREFLSRASAIGISAMLMQRS